MKLMINMDMIGYSRSATNLRVTLETASRYSDLSQLYQRLSQIYCPRLGVVVSFNPFGSDHVSYLSRGMRAILTIDNDWSTYPHYHRDSDRVQFLIPEMAVEILRLNVAVIATLTIVDN